MTRDLIRSIAIIGAVLSGCGMAWAEPRIYFGNLHSHTSLSDGSGTPAQAYRHAREAGRLDFLAITEHSHAAAESGAGDRRDGILIANDPSLYDGADAFSLISTAKAFTKANEFVALYGQEFSTISKSNHVNVFDAPKVIDAPNGRFDLLLQWIKANPDSSGRDCVIQFNHPKLLSRAEVEYGRDDFGAAGDSEQQKTQKWVAALRPVACLMEVLNGPAMVRDGGHRAPEVAEKDYLEYLQLGFRLAPTADQDNHYFTWGTATDARTAVVVDGEFTKASLLEALRARHVYATEDRNLRLFFTVNDKPCGDEIDSPTTGSILDIGFAIADDDEPAASYEVIVYSGVVGSSPARPIETFTVTATGNASDDQWTIDSVPYQGGAQYVFFKVVQLHEDGEDDRSWTAPVWIMPPGAAGGAAVVAGAPSGGASYASKRSNVYHDRADCRSGREITAANRVSGAEVKDGRRLCRNCQALAQAGVAAADAGASPPRVATAP
ncbi:MAG: CehA/McbA family metallohydrolase [Planctomycetes bacterium]|nr:CehA/McbA family metallohydrolase [Planctomycetota bacterium]